MLRHVIDLSGIVDIEGSQEHVQKKEQTNHQIRDEKNSIQTRYLVSWHHDIWEIGSGQQD